MTTTATAGVVAELRARLRHRQEALAQTGRMEQTNRLTRAWEGAGSICWWFYGSRQITSQRIREGTEALVLLGTLARIDFSACMDVTHDTWPREFGERKTKRYKSITPRLEIGFAYHVQAPDDIVPIMECIVSEEPPSQSFCDDYAWMKRAFPSLGVDGLSKLPSHVTPLRLLIRLGDDGAKNLAFVLRQLVQHVSATASRNRQSAESDDTLAAVVTRFQLVEIDLATTPTNVESLACLARLKQLGVRIPSLPSFRIDEATVTNSLDVTRALHTLLPPQSVSPRPTRQRTNQVFVTDTTTSDFLPAIWSAIHASQDVQTVRLEVHSDPTDINDPDDEFNNEEYPEPGTARTLWRWATYTLFSRHANQQVRNVVVYMDYVDQMLGEIEQILRADDPLAELFETKGENTNQWISATRFYVQDPSLNIRDDADRTSALLISPSPLLVRVIDCLESNCNKWWRVLLPGRGSAWVKDEDAKVEVAQKDVFAVNGFQRMKALSHLKLEGIYTHNIGDAMALLRLLPRGVGSIELESGVYADEEDPTNMDEWTTEVLRLLPDLERLKFPCLTEVTRLSIFVEAAQAGHACLRSLSLYNTFYTASPEIFAFVRVLSDTTHPLTRRLEELELIICAFEKMAEFDFVWCRMLKQNRTLHTISLVLTAEHCVKTDEKPIAIRTGPLALASKLAFLSVVRNRGVCGLLDTSVIAMIFEFAAPHRIRKVKIDWAT